MISVPANKVRFSLSVAASRLYFLTDFSPGLRMGLHTVTALTVKENDRKNRAWALA